MRCLSCNCELSDFEATRKYADTSTYIDLCNRCFSEIANDIHVIERPDLQHESYIDQEEFDEYEDE